MAKKKLQPKASRGPKPVRLKVKGNWQRAIKTSLAKKKPGEISFGWAGSSARAAVEMGIRDFDAQLLIACAIRKWNLDRRDLAVPNRDAPKLSFHHDSKIVRHLDDASSGLDVLLEWKMRPVIHDG